MRHEDEGPLGQGVTARPWRVSAERSGSPNPHGAWSGIWNKTNKRLARGSLGPSAIWAAPAGHISDVTCFRHRPQRQVRWR
eukprot:scaffold75249_cov63-Phaeocystis_antarctica.AAC.5